MNERNNISSLFICLSYFHDLPMGLHQYVTLFIDAACYLPGDVIVNRGDVVSAAYFISEGTASLRRSTLRCAF